MVHSDDLGLVLPPKVAPIQVVILPFLLGNKEEEIIAKAQEIEKTLKQIGIRVKLDLRDLRPGEKTFAWEKKGVPIRLELGPKDLENSQCVLVRRDTGKKASISLDNLAQTVELILCEIQQNLFERALQFQKSKIVEVKTWEEFKKAIEDGNFVIANYDGTAETEKKIKEELKVTTRYIPFDLEQDLTDNCVYSGKTAKAKVIFGKSY